MQASWKERVVEESSRAFGIRDDLCCMFGASGCLHLSDAGSRCAVACAKNAQVTKGKWSLDLNCVHRSQCAKISSKEELEWSDIVSVG